jgi:excisionase family DNA binding protein
LFIDFDLILSSSIYKAKYTVKKHLNAVIYDYLKSHVIGRFKCILKYNNIALYAHILAINIFPKIDFISLYKTKMIKLEVMEKKYLNLEEAANYLCTTESWIYQNHKRFGLPVLRVGRKLIFMQSELDNWLNQQASV